jgi:hypothetical protein
MVTPSAFPPYPQPTLTREDIIGYLVPFRNRGWDVFQGHNENEFIIKISETEKAYVWYALPHQANNQDACWVVASGIRKEGAIWGFPDGMQSLHALMTQAVNVGCHQSRTAEWAEPTGPKSARLWKQEPASNIGRIVALIGPASIEAVYDAYLDNRSLETLLSMITLGVRVSKTVRLLTSTQMVSPRNALPRVTKQYVGAWLREVAPNGEMRHNAYTGHERRFALLSGGRSLLLGFSLNNPGVNEASTVDTDAVDHPYFDSEWMKASSL